MKIGDIKIPKKTSKIKKYQFLPLKFCQLSISIDICGEII
jgi:hypothetical protein